MMGWPRVVSICIKFDYIINTFLPTGLVTLDEMKAKQEHVVKEREKQLAHKKAEGKSKEKQQEDKKKKDQKKVFKLIVLFLCV